MDIRRSVSTFTSDRRGTIAVIFAISSLVVFGGIGLSIDGARVYSAQHKLQQVVDSSALAAARYGALDGNASAIEATFTKFFDASGIASQVNVRSAVPDTSKPRRVEAEVFADVPTILMPLFGVNTVEVRAFAAVEYGLTRVEIALALDNTGSMAGAKLDSLKSSAHRLVDTLMDKAPETGAMRFSLVPFAQYVNVGLDKRGEPWLSVPDDYTQTREVCGEVRPVVSTSNCRTVTYTYNNDGVPMTGSYEQCDYVYGDPVYQCSHSTTNYSWHGCVGSRNYPQNIQDGSFASQVPGLMNTYCPSRIQALTDDRSTLHSAIDGMIATGETYLPSGIAWGVRVLSTSEPYAESAGDRTAPGGDRIKKILILMTDGTNTKSPTYPTHNGTDASTANSLTTEACNAAKAANIGVYTIAYDVTENAIKSLLRSCATSADRFYDAADSSQLDAGHAVHRPAAGLDAPDQLTN